MENTLDSKPKLLSTPPSSNEGMFSNKNTVIIVLVFLLVLSFLGINLLNIFGNWIQTLISIFGPLVSQILSIFGYTAGTVIDKSAEVVGDVATAGVDIAEGTLHSVGGLLKDASKGQVDDKAKHQLDKPWTLDNEHKPLDKEINNRKSKDKDEPKPQSASAPIQTPIKSNKSSWCLVGDYQGRRGCIEVSDQDKCLSGQVFPNQKMCLNPTLTNNMPLNLKSTRG